MQLGINFSFLKRSYEEQKMKILLFILSILIASTANANETKKCDMILYSLLSTNDGGGSPSAKSTNDGGGSPTAKSTNDGGGSPSTKSTNDGGGSPSTMSTNDGGGIESAAYQEYLSCKLKQTM